MFALFAMFLFPESKKIRAIRQESPYTVDVILGDGLQDDTAEVIFRNMHLRASLNPVFAAKLRWDHKLALRSECRTKLIHALHYSKVRLALICWIHNHYDLSASAGVLPVPSKCASISSRVFPFVSGRNATAVMK